MGHGANAAAVPMDVRASREGGDTECVNDLAGTLCVKAGMDAENVVVVVVEAPGIDPGHTIGADRGVECTAEAAAAAMAAEETALNGARKNRDDLGEGGLWRNNVVAAPEPETSPETSPAGNVHHGHAHDLHLASPVAPGAEVGTEVTVRRPGSGVRVSARMFSLRGYRTDPDIDADIWRRS